MDEKLLKEILGKYPQAARENLIPILQEIQGANGYLSENALVEVGRYLQIPASKIYGLSTFYDQFQFEPPARFSIQVCRGTSCHVNDSVSIIEEFEKKFRLKPGQTTRDGVLHLEVTGCMGACGLGPVMQINEDYFTEVKASDIREIVESYIHREG